MMKRAAFSSASTHAFEPSSRASTIQVWAPDDVRDYKLRREDDESDASFEERKSFFNELLKRGGR